MSGVSIDEAHSILEANFADWVRDLDLTVIETGSDHVVMHIAFSPRLCRVGGIICGQALIAAADTAMILALASAQGGMRPMTTVDLTSNFMRPIREEDVRLAAVVKRLGKTLAFCTTDIAGTASGSPAAFATGTYAILG